MRLKRAVNINRSKLINIKSVVCHHGSKRPPSSLVLGEKPKGLGGKKFEALDYHLLRSLQDSLNHMKGFFKIVGFSASSRNRSVAPSDTLIWHIFDLINLI